MAGLLDVFNSDEGRLGLGLLAAAGPSMAPMNGASRMGLAFNTSNALKDQSLDQGFRKLQMDSLVETIAANKRKNEILNGLLGGFAGGAQPAPIDASSAALGAGAQAGSIGPTNANAARLPQQPAGPMSGMTPDMLYRLKLGANIDLADIYKLTQPQWMNVGGNVVNTNDPNFRGGFQSQVQQSANGQTSLLQPDGKGGVTVSAPEGALPTFSAYQNAEQRAKNANTPLPLGYVDDRTGKPVGGSIGNYLDRQPMPNRAGGTLTPELAQFIRQDAARNGIANPQAAFTGAGPGGTYGLDQTQNSPLGGLQGPATAKLNETIATNEAGQVNEAYTKAVAAKQSLPALWQAQEMLKSGTFTGLGADAKMNVLRALSAIGIPVPDSVANSQNFDATLSQIVGKNIKAIVGSNGISNADVKFVQGMFGQRGQEAKAIQHILSRAVESNMRDINAHNDLLSKVEANGGQSAIGKVDAPTPPAQGKAFDTMPPANVSNKGRFLTDQTTGQRFQSNGLQWVEVKGK